jgi:type I restriction enzyme S subunit
MGAIKKLNRYEKGVVSTLYICFRILNGNYSADFYEKYFDSGLFNREIEKIAQEGARNHGLLNVSVVDFFSSTILPCPSIEEQIKIANFLSSIDKKIENTKNELEKTKEFKKALLQQMFV